MSPNLQPLPGSKQLAAMIGTTTMAAAPTYAAAPVQYAQYAQYADAPVQYAAAPVSYAAPAQMMTTMAAPVTTMAPSYVAAPQQFASAVPQYANPINVPNAPIAPGKLTEGIPTPAQILSQKNGYAAALDKQLKEASDTVAKETAIEKEMVKFNAAKQIAMFENQVDEKLTEGLALEDERATFALLVEEGACREEPAAQCAGCKPHHGLPDEICPVRVEAEVVCL